MALPNDAPPWIHELLDAVVVHGFVQVEEREHPEAFGSYYTTYLHNHLLVRASKDGREQGKGRWQVELTDDRRTRNAFDMLPWSQISYLAGVANEVANEKDILRTEAADQVRWLLDNFERSISLTSKLGTWDRVDEFHHQHATRYRAERAPRED